MIGKGKPLGWFPSFDIEEKEMQLQDNDRIILYTDGITKNVDPNGNFFGEDLFKDFIISEKSSHPEKFSIKLLEELEKFSGSNSFNDDITLMVLDILKTE